mmetsp:Transcript_27780/g.58696  ORF Transcript_27780/g.58696 Transcript_27780/m.58696 type:complete len:212 (-) Transcript_27780:483-1118(-)
MGSAAGGTIIIVMASKEPQQLLWQQYNNTRQPPKESINLSLRQRMDGCRCRTILPQLKLVKRIQKISKQTSSAVDVLLPILLPPPPHPGPPLATMVPPQGNLPHPPGTMHGVRPPMRRQQILRGQHHQPQTPHRRTPQTTRRQMDPAVQTPQGIEGVSTHTLQIHTGDGESDHRRGHAGIRSEQREGEHVLQSPTVSHGGHRRPHQIFGTL